MLMSQNKNRTNKSQGEQIFSWVQKGIDTKIVFDLCRFAYTCDKTKNNTAIIISGDADFAETIKSIRELRINTELIAFNRPSYQSHDLMKSADVSTVLDYAQLNKAGII